MFLEVEEGRQDQYGRSRKNYLIRFIADLPLDWYMGCVIEYLKGVGTFLFDWEVMILALTQNANNILCRDAFYYAGKKQNIIVIVPHKLRGHLQTDILTLNVKMTFKGEGFVHLTLNVQKCVHKPTFLVKIVTLREGIST